MNISNTTQQLILENGAILSSTQLNTTIQLNTPFYMTRLQSKLFQYTTLIIQPNTTLIELFNIIENMAEQYPYIKRYSKKYGQGYVDINIHNNIIYIHSIVKSIYAFITSYSGFNILVSLFNDNYNPHNSNINKTITKKILLWQLFPKVIGLDGLLI